MIPSYLQAVFSSLADAGEPVGDGELLRRFLAGEEGAFADLVRRHGRLVWAVCRTVAGSDAEADDAFQATFLVLLRSARTIRDPGRLSAWLHGVAYQVCSKARRAAKRRTTHEQVAGVSAWNGSAVPDSAWDRAMAAVHEELGTLPETLRVPFVLCCLEGKGVTEAAEQLGWKLGTFSGRLTRAKDTLVARLDARGLTLGVVAGLGLATPPPAAVARAAALAQVGFVIPGPILQLSQGVIGMSTKWLKVLAVMVLLTGGLGLSVGTGGLATADAQPGATVSPPKPDPEAEVKRLEAELEKARRAAYAATVLNAYQQWTREMPGGLQKGNAQEATGKPLKWEYKVASLGMDGLVAEVGLNKLGEEGWELASSLGAVSSGPSLSGGSGPISTKAILIFKRPKK